MNDQAINQILQNRQASMPRRFGYKLVDGNQFGLDVSISPTLDIDEAKMSVWIPFADGSRRDGVGDLLEVGGIKTDRHVRNPLVLFDHAKVVALPVALAEDPETKAYTVELDPMDQTGRANCFFYRGTGLKGLDSTREYDHAVFCEQLYDLIAKRYVRGGSIGYQVIKAMPLQTDYDRGIQQGLHLLQTLMLELSAVVMPANADTVRKMLDMPQVCGKNLSPYLVKSLQAYAPEQTKAVFGYEGKSLDKFHKPENYDKIQDLPGGLEMWAGANDWGCGWTWVWLMKPGGKEPVKYQKIDHSQCVCKNDPDEMKTALEKQCLAYGKEQAFRWVEEQTKKSVTVPFTENLTHTNIPPVRWKPGLGAIKQLRKKYKALKEEDGRWITLSGTHVFVNKEGIIEKGPKDFQGKKPNEIGGGKPASGNLSQLHKTRGDYIGFKLSLMSKYHPKLKPHSKRIRECVTGCNTLGEANLCVTGFFQEYPEFRGSKVGDNLKRYVREAFEGEGQIGGAGAKKRKEEAKKFDKKTEGYRQRIAQMEAEKKGEKSLGTKGVNDPPMRHGTAQAAKLGATQPPRGSQPATSTPKPIIRYGTRQAAKLDKTLKSLREKYKAVLGLPRKNPNVDPKGLSVEYKSWSDAARKAAAASRVAKSRSSASDAHDASDRANEASVNAGKANTEKSHELAGSAHENAAKIHGQKGTHQRSYGHHDMAKVHYDTQVAHTLASEAHWQHSGTYNKVLKNPNVDPKGKSQIAGDLNWLKEEQLEAEHKSLELRKKYRNAKGLSHTRRKSVAGQSSMYVREKDLQAVKTMAESSGLKFQHVTTNNGFARVKLIGDGNAMGMVAKEFGRRKV